MLRRGPGRVFGMQQELTVTKRAAGFDFLGIAVE